MIQFLALTTMETEILYWVTIVGIVGTFLLIYMTPTIIAVCSKHPATLGIAALNIVLGWSVIIWVVVFVWACIKPRKTIEVIPQFLPPAPPPVPRQPRLETSLEEIQHLRDRNLITEDEFQERRKQLLARF